MSRHYDPERNAQYRRTTASMGSVEGITIPKRKCSRCGGYKTRVRRVGGSGSRLDPYRYECTDCSSED